MRFAIAFLAFACAVNAKTFCLTVAGMGGEEEYDQKFSSWAQEIDKTMKASGPDTIVETLFGPNATKAQVRSTLENFSRQAAAQDALVIMLIGHGGFDGTDYKMNLPGPDISATELAAYLDRVPATRQLVVNMTSASGGSIHALSKPTRVVITATKTGTEKNATVFARYWAEALRDAAADTDKNEVISALEAYKYAEQKTKQFYEAQKRLSTEHALLDNGEPQGATAAGRFALLRIGSVQKAAADPAKRALLSRREELEQEIDTFKLQKAAMPADEYKKQLSTLLLDLARTQAELDK